uniref:Brevican core protein n=1 Tax=Knipowitschia caucasica TaxID=637954 RepID=A0AAV2KBK5_KNICA
MTRGNRNVETLSLLCALWRLSLAFPALTLPPFESSTHLQVKIPDSDVIVSSLGSSVALPCLMSLSTGPSSIEPRVKWSVVSGGREQQIVVARGDRVKVSEAFKDRAELLNYSSSTEDLTLRLSDLRSSDSGHYRCEVQHGLEDASDLVQLQVKGVVFHYRDAMGRYAFSFPQAQKACEAIGAEVASPDHLLAAYHDGYEQCDAGWLADQSVRYPIQMPREGCYGDMDGLPGVRNYGTMDPSSLYDVYCFIDHMHGEVFAETIPQQLSFPLARALCSELGAELASTAQLYLAWSEGMDRCSPGWLSDASVRYPIITPRERCGGSQPGVKTVYRFSNQTGFPEPSRLHDVYCFRGNGFSPTASAIHSTTAESEDIGESVVILTEKDQELQLHGTEQVEREAMSFLETFSLFSAPVKQKTPPRANKTESSHNITTKDANDLSNATSADIADQFLDEEDTATILEENEPTEPAEMEEEMQTNSTEVDSSEDPTEEDMMEEANTTTMPTMHQEQSLVNGTEAEVRIEANTTTLPTIHQEESTVDPIEKVMMEETNATTLPIMHHEESEVGSIEKMMMEETNATTLPIMHHEESEVDSIEKVMMEETNATTLPIMHHVESEVSSIEKVMMEETNATTLPIMHHEESTVDSIERVMMEETNATTLPIMHHEESEVGSIEEVMMEEANTTTLPIMHKEESEVGRIEEIMMEKANTTTLPIMHQKSNGEDLSLLTEAPEEEDMLAEPTQAVTSSTEDLRAWISQDGSGDESQEIDTDAATLTVLADFPTSAPIPSDRPRETPTQQTVLNLTTSPLTEMIRQNESVESEEAAMVQSEEIKLITTHSENLLESSLSFGTTETPEVSYSSMKPDYREYLVSVTDAFQEASGQEPETVIAYLDEPKPTVEDGITPTSEDDLASLEDENAILEDVEKTGNSTIDEDNEVPQENITASPTFESLATEDFLVVTDEELLEMPTNDIDYPTSSSNDSHIIHWSTTTRAQNPEYNRNPSTLENNSAKTTTARPYWTRRTPWTTASPKVNRETSSPQTVTVHIPPVDSGRADHTFSLTPPPSLHVLPVERAAIGGTGKISDGCLNDPCLNGGTCTEQNGRIKCLCLPSYGGDLCQTDLELCEVGWDKFQGSCYRHFGRRLSWEVAEQHCRMMGAHLVSIMSPEEQGFINSLKVKDFYKEYQWTGLNDKAIEDDFRWSDGSPLLYENWYRGQPDSYFLSGEDCVVMVWHDSGRWSDVPCNYHLAYTCKKGTSSCGPPPRVRNASIFGKVKPRYPTNAAVRYHCAEGFQQRLNPLVRCQSGGKWERPQIHCIPENGSLTQFHSETPTDNRNLAAIEDEWRWNKSTIFCSYE